ncbi:hypothetical protein D9611_005321 [Ephemerocybe angulata]|uniref:F-box domain-containing protein n=1 Tax=Ephemerocybe angulata TaxID=980116 RepID=A0A8H5FDP7_9AGAR|nr:hypothetical protein D9611_005321 [Tulosesus angulatus]
MDQCLQIPDIVDSICAHTTRKTAFSMALTCHSFLEPSLNRIWRDIDSFAPLLACLPPNAFQVEYRAIPGSTRSLLSLYQLSANRALTPADLRRYRDRYAHRIRTFLPTPSRSPQCIFISAKLFQALSLATDNEAGALSPRLVEFSWLSPFDYSWVGFGPEYAEEVSPFISLFLGKSVTSITFHISGPSPLQTASIQSVARRLPEIKTFTCRAEENVRFPRELILAHSWDRLEELDIGGISASEIGHIVSLPQLATLSLHLSGPIFTPQHPEEALTSERFLNLRDVLITVANVELVIEFLKLIPANNGLCAFKSEVFNYAPAALAQIVVDIFAAKLNRSTLEVLTLHDDSCGVHGDAAAEDDEPTEIDFYETVDITSLYSFNKLIRLFIGLQGGVHINPKEIAQIPRVWPDIRLLSLTSTFPTGQTPRIDHMDLLHLTRACPSLEYLGLCFDATHIPSSPILVEGTNLVETLRVGGSPISSVLRTTAFLRTHFPMLRHIYGRGYNSHISKRRWDLVQKAISSSFL